MAKKTPSKRRTLKKGVNPPPSNAFDDLLEDRDLYDCGEPTSDLEPLYNSGRTRRVGWWREIEGLGRDGLACGEGPYWSDLEIVLPDFGLMMEARSLESDDRWEPARTFYLRNIFCRQTSKKVIRLVVFDGETKGWKKYSCGRIEAAIREGVTESPWLYFDFTGADIAFDPDCVRLFLQRVAEPRSTTPRDRKSCRRILESIYELDPDGLVGEISAVVTDRTELEDTIRRLIPRAFHEADVERAGDASADRLAAKFDRTKRTILRWARELKCEHRTGQRGRFLFSRKDAQRIYEAINAERTRTRNPDQPWFLHG